MVLGAAVMGALGGSAGLPGTVVELFDAGNAAQTSLQCLNLKLKDSRVAAAVVAPFDERPQLIERSDYRAGPLSCKRGGIDQPDQYFLE
jgi:hypothetical protein